MNVFADLPPAEPEKPRNSKKVKDLEQANAEKDQAIADLKSAGEQMFARFQAQEQQMAQMQSMMSMLTLNA